MTAWYVARGGQQSGPMSREQLEQMAMAEQLGPDAWVAEPEVNGWVPAAQLFGPARASKDGPLQPYAPPTGPMPSAVDAGGWIGRRLLGVLATGVGLLVLAGNVGLIVLRGHFFPKTLVFAFGALGFGSWVMIFGDARDRHTRQVVPWKRAGQWTLAALGVIVGLVLSVVLSDGTWDPGRR
jgi:hypothetical protein